MTISETLKDLGARAENVVQGIPWSQLESEGKLADYVGSYLAPAFNDAMLVMNTLYYDFTLYNAASTAAAVKDVTSTVVETANRQLDLVLHGSLTSMLRSGLALSIRAFRDFISLAYGVAFFGAKLHSGQTDYAALSTIPDWKSHADRVYRILRAIKMLDDAKALTWLKWDSSFMEELRVEQGYAPGTKNPLGIAPIIAAIIGSVVALVLIAGLIIWANSTNEVNRKALATLQELCTAKDQSDAVKSQCVKALAIPQASFAAVVQKVAETAIQYLFWGALIVGGIYFAPKIVHSIKEARKEARQPA